jgi:Amt family ammonium transporter
LKEYGVFDFAGGIVVHATAGFGALAGVIVLGARKPQPDETEEDINTPHNIPMVALGTGLLWVGWFGFNAGSALNANEYAAYAAVNSEISASVALTTWVLIDWYRDGKPNMVGLCVGAVAGLATITPAAGFVKPWAAAIIGLLAALFCYTCVEFRKKMKWDDALDVWGVHGMGGVLGTLSIGVFGSMQGADASAELFGKQLGAVALVSAYSFILTFVLLKIINIIPGLHLLPTDKEQKDGLDFSFHGEKAYTSVVRSLGQEKMMAMQSYALTAPTQRKESSNSNTSIQVNLV